MSPIIKDSDAATGTRETGRSGSGGSSADSGVKPQPIPMEIPITVNGARTVEGSDKREPFSESTKTVMVFGSGAVIRLTSPLAPGQLLFLTNDRTKKEVVCQVVKSKNYRSISGYVELEFTEPAVGFWGMRFPGDRIDAGRQAAPEAARPSAGSVTPTVASPVPTKTEQPAAKNVSGNITAKPPAPSTASLKPAVPAPASSPAAPVPSFGSEERLVEPWLKKRAPAPKIPAAPAPVAPPQTVAKPEEAETSLATTRNFELSRPSDKAASIFAPSEAPASLSSVDLSSLAPFFEVKPGPTEQPALAPQAPPAKDDSTEDLKQHTARLQEELSKMQFAETASSSSSPAEPGVKAPSACLSEPAVSLLKTEPVHESPVRLVEDAPASSGSPVLPELPKIEEPSKGTPLAPIPALEALEQEELKIPAWLAPLARNTAAPSSTQELVLREKAKRTAEQPEFEEVTAPVRKPAEKQHVGEARVPEFGSALPFSDVKVKSARESRTKKSGSGMLIGAIAAGLLVLAGGGWWYRNQQAARVHASVPAAQTGGVSSAAQDVQTNSPKEAKLGVIPSPQMEKLSSQGKLETANSNATASSAPTTAAHDAQAALNSPGRGSSVATATSAQPEPAPAEIKKPVLGEVRLATPKVSQKRTVQTATAPDAEIPMSEEQPDASADSLAGLAAGSNQPAAPVAPIAVGGEVKQAKLISSVPPEYPALAKAQHVSGAVTIDALIEANGRVTKTKVISGPALLQQAAIEALKQWKYQPATLDGKAVAMHLTVTIQFRLQP